MIRVVIDTNVVVSAMLRSGGLPESIFNLAISGSVQFFVSRSILEEYEEVLRRPRLAIEAGKINWAIARIGATALLVAPGERITAALDPDDNMFLECAQAAGADYLVTGNIRHYPKNWETTQIVTPRQFIYVWEGFAAGFN